MTRVEADLKLLADLNGGSLKGVEKDPERLLTLLQRVYGDAATLQSWADLVRRYEVLRERGLRLATFLVTYGIPPHALDADDREALLLVRHFGHALRVRQQAEAAAVAGGAVGSEAYYATYTDGDMKEARRLRHEALAARELR